MVRLTPLFAIYCSCGKYLEVTSRTLLYTHEQLAEIFKKHMRDGCKLVDKETFLSIKKEMERKESAKRVVR